jgi:hypothetical protein
VNAAELKKRVGELVRVRERGGRCEVVFCAGDVRLAPASDPRRDVADRSRAVIAGVVEEWAKALLAEQKAEAPAGAGEED